MLTQKAKYAIKALICLAERNALTPTREIAEEAAIPKKFLEAILLELKSHKIVSSVQGATGGYRLSKNPRDITLAAVYRIFDGPIALVPCASLNFYSSCPDCKNERYCSVKRAMIKVRESTLASLEAQTIGSMMKKQK